MLTGEGVGLGTGAGVGRGTGAGVDLVTGAGVGLATGAGVGHPLLSFLLSITVAVSSSSSGVVVEPTPLSIFCGKAVTVTCALRCRNIDFGILRIVSEGLLFAAETAIVVNANDIVIQKRPLVVAGFLLFKPAMVTVSFLAFFQ